MVRDRQHGPTVELNRITMRKLKAKQAAASANNAAAAGGQIAAAVANTAASAVGPPTGITTDLSGKTVFSQMTSKTSMLPQEALLLSHRIWKVKFVGKRKIGK